MLSKSSKQRALNEQALNRNRPIQKWFSKMNKKHLEEMISYVQRNLAERSSKGADFQAAIWRLVDIIKELNKEIETIKNQNQT